MPANALRLNNVAMIANSGPSFVGPLDALIANGASLYRGFSTRRLRAAFTGAPARLFSNGTGAPEEDIPFSAGNVLDTTAAAALIAQGGGTRGYWRTWYDQSTNASNATQATDANAVHFSTLKFSDGGIGGGFSQTTCWLNASLKSFSLPFTVTAVLHFQVGGFSRYVFGNASGTTDRFIRSSSSLFQANSGATVGASSSVAIPLPLILTVVFNGSGTKFYYNESLVGTADAGNTALDFTSSQINQPGGGLAFSGGNGNSIAEFLVFDGDVTTVTGWADFSTSTKTHFGIA